jgi:hypothetical protein
MTFTKVIFFSVKPASVEGINSFSVILEPDILIVLMIE